jgi:hypothetical protein
MIVTEEVAKTKQCQQSYAATSVSRNQNAAGMVHSLLTDWLCTKVAGCCIRIPRRRY